MLRFLICKSQDAQCLPTDQVWSTTAEIMDPAQFGLSPECVLLVISFGFAVVLMGFLLGYGISLATGLIKRL